MTRDYLESRIEELKRHVDQVSQQYCTINGRLHEAMFILKEMDRAGTVAESGETLTEAE